MNITFLVGNGFDLNLGLLTSYKDFYKYYIKREPDDLIAKSISNDYKLWADLELGLGEFLKSIEENQINDFLNSKAKLEKHLIEYLGIENRKLLIKDEQALSEEFKTKIPNFFQEFSLKELQHYQQFIRGISEKITYKFISFNYTNTLDKIIDVTIKNAKPFATHKYPNYTNPIQDVIELPLHIHGSLNKNLILGINDTSQIMNSKLKDNSDLTDFIIKTRVNETLGELNISRTKEIINSSKYICIFGLSIGDTDNYWWSYLIEWLLKDANNRLVLFTYNNTIIQSSAQEKLRFANSKQRSIISRNQNIDEKTVNKIKEKIIVIQNSKIFDFENIEIKSTIDE